MRYAGSYHGVIASNHQVVLALIAERRAAFKWVEEKSDG